MCHKRITILIYLLFALASTLSNTVWATENEPSSLTVKFEQDNFLLKVVHTPLHVVLDEILYECSLDISGLENRENELITFAFQGEITDGIKQFLKYLGEKNYAFEFANESLMRVLIYPGSNSANPSGSNQVDVEHETPSPSTVVRVEDIIEGSQAQVLGLAKGDLIIEYDGVKIRTNRQLIKQTVEKSYKDQIDMIVVRNNVLMPFVVTGGKIGVRIRTVRLPKDELEYYDSEP